MNKKNVFRELSAFQETSIKKEYKNISFTIVLVQPEHAANIGAIARLMKNFDFQDLVIFNPIEEVKEIKSHRTCGYAMHGKDVLMNSKIILIERQEDHMSKLKKFLKLFDLIIGTTAKGKNYSNIKRIPIFPEDLSIPISKKPLKIAFLFGKESRGLTNDEVDLADIVLRIPASNDYPTLNLSHSCGIILYEIYKKINSLNIGRGKNPVLLADKEDRVILYKIIKEIINVLKIRTYKKNKVLKAFKNVYERAFMSKKELSLIMGVFSKLNSIMSELDLYQ
ncbi:MAG: TrmJ/YjtD family RNA methyltransferase [Promethearchaeota archaeon]|nr:MAG: TrmJ/YjtD family RNA methyltransferase [Candidatus Lokiarchaeota archaeon]